MKDVGRVCKLVEFSTLSMAAARGSRGEWILSLSRLRWRSLSPLWLPFLPLQSPKKRTAKRLRGRIVIRPTHKPMVFQSVPMFFG